MRFSGTLLLCVALTGCGSRGLPSTSSHASGAPGARATWTNGNKQGVGTSSSLASKVWFTLGDGVITEVYYPAVDRANLRLLEFIVTAPGGFFERESLDTTHQVEVVHADALLFRQINTSRTNRYRITRTVFTDPARQAVIVQARFEPLMPGTLSLWVYVDPAINNSGLKDVATASSSALVAYEADMALAVTASRPFTQATAGFVGRSDGVDSLKRTGRIEQVFPRTSDGNVALLGGLADTDVTIDVTLAVAFGRDEEAAVREALGSLARPAAEIMEAYVREWQAYVRALQRVPPPYDRQFQMAAMMLRAHEDKTRRGAMIASLTVPWGHETDASEGNVGGYHLVWSRDLYQVALAFDAMGDREAAMRALEYIFTVQQRPDGSVPQNSWLDGRPYWTSLQLDEVAYPILLAEQLGRTDAQTWERHVKRAADFLVGKGPATPQERWEEESGYSPSTIAAEIAGLVAAASIAERNGDTASAERYRRTAEHWEARLDAWTVTRTGPHSRNPYFLRLTQRGRPDAGEMLELNNGSGSFDERTIVDAGFLELVRLGIRPPDTPLMKNSLAVVDRVIGVRTPNGPAWYRYNHDGYGEKPNGRGYDGTGVGRLWPLLTGERGEYELAAGRDAGAYLDALAAFANDSLMLPEQVWDRPDSPGGAQFTFGEGTGSATPLAWTNAGFIRLALGIQQKRVVGTPEVVRRHFLQERQP
jgi:glucan 1,4-alpha-glucosidase